MQLAIWTVLFSPLVQAATDRRRGYRFMSMWETMGRSRHRRGAVTKKAMIGLAAKNELATMCD
jgi:hypothetical protein